MVLEQQKWGKFEDTLNIPLLVQALLQTSKRLQWCNVEGRPMGLAFVVP